MVWAAACTTVALLLFGAARGFGQAAGAGMLLGLGAGWLNTGGNALVSDVYPEDRGKHLNLVGLFFPLGALFVPLLVSLTFGILSVGGILIVLAGVAGVATIASVPLRFPPPRERASFSFTELLRVGKEPGVFLLAFLLFFQSGNEAAVSGWTTTYVGSVGWSPRVATVILLGYWVMAIVGRSASVSLQARIGKERLVLGAGALAAIGCVILLLGARSLPVLTLGVWTTAVALAPVFPTTLAMAGDKYQRFAGTVFGFLFTISNFGGMTFPWALGYLSESAGVRMGMLVPLVGTLGVTLCAFVVLRKRRE
jgi:fucose permease